MEGLVHAMIISKAVDLLKKDRAVYAAWGRQGLANLCEGVLHADYAGVPQYLLFKLDFLCGAADVELGRVDLTNSASDEHYFDPLTQAGLNLSHLEPLDFVAGLISAISAPTGIVSVLVDVVGVDLDKQYRSAADCCRDHYLKAINAWRGDATILPGLDRRSAAMRELGWACHFIGDLCVSAHTLSQPPLQVFMGHQDYERLATTILSYENDYLHADGVKEELLQLATNQNQDAKAIAATVAGQTRGEYDLFLDGLGLLESNEEKWVAALATAIPRAERYTAMLLTRFFHEVGISEEPLPLTVNLVTPDQTRIAHAILFFRSADDPEPNQWKLLTADESGVISFCAQLGSTYQLLPAMPGYVFEGKHYGDYGEGDLIPDCSPVTYVHKATVGITPSMYLVLRKLPVVLTVPKPHPIPVQLAWQLGRSIFANAQKQGSVLPRPPGRHIMKKEELRVADAREQQLDITVMDEHWKHNPYLAPGSNVFIRIATFSLVDVAGGDFITSHEKLEGVVNQQLEGAKIQVPAWSKTVRDAWNRLPKVEVKLPGGRVATARQLSLPTSGSGEITKFHSAIALPGLPGSTISVEIIGDTGCIGKPVRVEAKTDQSGIAMLRVQAGSERGILRLKITVLQAPHLPEEMLPKPRTLDLIVYPGLDGAVDVVPATPPSLMTCEDVLIKQIENALQHAPQMHPHIKGKYTGHV